MTVGPVRILFVEDDIAEQVNIERFIRGFTNEYLMQTVGSMHAAVRSMKRESFDLALIDYRFSDGTALDLLDELGETPAIFLTEGGQEEVAALVLERGAYDFLMKDSARNYLMLLPGTIHKVLSRKQTEQALRQSESRCKDMLDVMLDMYFCVSEEGTVLLANRAGALRLGYTVGEMMGMPLEQVVYPADADTLKQLLLHATSSPDQSHRGSFRLVRKGGEILGVSADVHAQPERGRQIPVIRLLCREERGRTAAGARLASVGGGAMEGRNGKAAVTGPARPLPVAASMEITDEITGTERVLIVDEMQEQRAVAARMLAKLGYRVVTAESGRSAIQLMKAGEHGANGNGSRSPFDLVLLDVGMDGEADVLGPYREILDAYPGQRCVIVSGGCDVDSLKEARTLGAREFVSKPYSFQTLGRAVRKELGRSHKA